MGGVKNRDAKRKANHVVSSGAGGGGTKGPAVVDKRGIEQPCPYCDKIYKEIGRLRDHLAKKHPNGADSTADGEASSSGATGGQQPGGTLKAADGPTRPSSGAPAANSAATASSSTNTGPAAAPAAAARSAAAVASTSGRMMEANSPAGYYTEKSPKMLLQEWCMRAKRPRARFRTMPVDKDASGSNTNDSGQKLYRCKVVLPDAKRPGTDKDIVVWLDARHAAPDEQEVEHRGAVAALHRVAGDRSMDYVLPQRYKSLWAALGEEAVQREQWRREAQAREAVRKEREAARRNMTARKAPVSVVMSEQQRRAVEGIVRDLRADGADQQHMHADDTEAAAEVAALTDQLQQLGFEPRDALPAARAAYAGRPDEAEEGSTSDEVAMLESALDWLCIHVDEARLPRAFGPGALGRTIAVLHLKDRKGAAERAAALAAAQQQQQQAAERAEAASMDPHLQAVLAFGFPQSHAQAALEASGGDVRAAVTGLLVQLLQEAGVGAEPEQGYEAAVVPAAADNEDAVEGGAQDAWAEEFGVLQAIYGEGDAVRLSPDHTRLSLECPEVSDRVQLHVWRPSAGTYPHAPPSVAVACAAIQPAARLWLSLHLGRHAATLLGEAMVYELATAASEWMSSQYDSQQQDLPPPFDRAPGSSAVAEDEVAGGAAAEAAAALLQAAADRRAAQQVVRQRRQAARHQPSQAQVEAESRRLLQEQQRLQADARHESMRGTRSRLPAAAKRADVLQCVSSNQVVVISGATGCGKSTQVPQYLLEEATEEGRGGACSVIITQPRRIAAVGLASRVAAERGERLGDVVGYSVRLDNKQSARTRLLFCTTGILLRRLMSDPELLGVSHVVVDEVHERSVDSDLLLLLLRQLLVRAAVTGRPAPRVVLMSATADAQLFARYFEIAHQAEAASAAEALAAAGGRARPAPPVRVACLTIPGFTHPVREFYLEDVLESTGYVIGRGSKWAKKKAPSSGAASSKGASTQSKGAAASSARKPPGSWEEEEEQQGEGLLGSGYSAQTAKSLAVVDQSLLNYELLEALVVHVLQQERQNGPGALLQGWPELATSSSPPVSDPDANAILIFMPGAPEIDRLVRALSGSPKVAAAAGGDQLRVLPLHGALPATAQARVFERAGRGVRKIVVATNVAETSITIDDIACVVDACRVKEMRYDVARGLSRLQECWVSQAAAQQRRGRAGRVRPGACFRLVSRRQWDALAPQQQPEVLRIPLEQLCLSIKSTLGSGARLGPSLARLLTAPSEEAVEEAVGKLTGMGALDSAEELTALGRHAAVMPMDPRLSKALVYGCMLRCVGPMLTIAAAMAHGRPAFVTPPDKRSEADAAKKQLAKLAYEQRSDHLAVIAAYNGWSAALAKGGRRAAAEFAGQAFVSDQCMEAIQAGRADFAAALADLGFLPPEYVNSLRSGGRGGRDAKEGSSDSEAFAAAGGADEYSSNARIVKAALCAGFYPSVLRVEHPAAKYQKVEGGARRIDNDASQIKFFDRHRGRVFLHPSSVCFGAGRFDSGWLVASEVVETSKVFVREASMVPVYALLLFGGELQVHHQESLLVIDGWARFKAPARIGVLVRELRGAVEQLLLTKLEDPGLDLGGQKAVQALHALLATDGF